MKTSLDQHYLMSVLLNHVEDAIYFKDLDSRFCMANAALQRALRANSLDEVIGRTDADFFSSAHAQEAFATEQNIIRTLQPQLNLEEMETFSDGSVRWASTSKYPLLGRDGVVIGTFGISRDITERKETEARVAKLQADLLVSERRLAVVDFADVVLFHMRNMADVSGEAIGRISSAFDGGHIAKVRAQAEALLNGIPAGSPALETCISLLGEVEMEFEQQSKNQVDLIELKRQLQGIIELVEAHKKLPSDQA